MLRWMGATLLASAVPVGCRRVASSAPPLLQRGYLWQREWNAAVTEAMAEADQRLDGIVVLGGEIVWEQKSAKFIRASIHWEALSRMTKPVALGLRVAPFNGPFLSDDATIRSIRDAIMSLADEALRRRVQLSEFHLDFDCAQKKLAGYRVWLQTLRPGIRPLPLIITTLPSWLGESEFTELLHEVDWYVLQVHSVPIHDAGDRASLLEDSLARRWVGRAASLGSPFSVALPTYRCLAGYNAAGALYGVAMDSVQPAWPPNTRVLELSANANEIAKLVQDWQSDRPAGLRELLWYRLPVKSDTRNWRWPTLAAVMAGRKPTRKFNVLNEGENPVDFFLENAGESDNGFDGQVVVTWSDSALIASDALPGWTCRVEDRRAIFTPSPATPRRLSPGGKRGIGWLRYEQTALLQSKVVEGAATAR